MVQVNFRVYMYKHVQFSYVIGNKGCCPRNSTMADLHLFNWCLPKAYFLLTRLRTTIIKLANSLTI